jgi:hypothetical protein
LERYAAPFTAQSDARIRARVLAATARRPRFARRSLVAAAVIAALTLASGTALAVAFKFDFRQFYTSFFNNPRADVIEVDKTASVEVSGGGEAVVGGLEITLRSAFMGGGTAHLVMDLRDLSGASLPEDVSFMAQWEDYIDAFVTVGDVEKNSDGSLTVSATMRRIPPTPRQGVAPLKIIAVNFGAQYVEAEPLDFNLAVYMQDTPEPDTSYSPETPAQTRFDWRLNYVGDASDNLKALADAANALRPLAGVMAVAAPGMELYTITALGVVDGNLHIQYARPGADELAGQARDFTDLREGEFILIDDKGGAVRSKYEFFRYTGGGTQHELVFPGYSGSSGYTLGFLGTRTDRVVTGQWDLSFETPEPEPAAPPYKIKTLDAEITLPYKYAAPYITSLSAEVTAADTKLTYKTVFDPLYFSAGVAGSTEWEMNMTPAERAALEESLREMAANANRFDTPEMLRSAALQHLAGNTARDYIASFPDPFLTFRDGSILTLSTSPDDKILYSSSCDAYGGELYFRPPHIDVDEVKSVTFCGVEYLF